eukprot:5720326-Amphidinium_carterae.1
MAESSSVAPNSSLNLLLKGLHCKPQCKVGNNVNRERYWPLGNFKHAPAFAKLCMRSAFENCTLFASSGMRSSSMMVLRPLHFSCTLTFVKVGQTLHLHHLH